MQYLQLKEEYVEEYSILVRREEPKPKKESHWFFREILLLSLIIAGYLFYTREEFELVLPGGGRLRSQYKIVALPRLTSASLRHRVRNGETLGGILSGYGFISEVASELDAKLKTLSEQGVPSSLKIGQELSFNFSEQQSFPEIEFPIDPAKKVVLTKDGESYRAKLLELPKLDRELTTSGVIESSFAQGVGEHGISYGLIDDVVDIFSASVNFHKDFRKGDKFKLIYQKTTLKDGTLVKEGPILAALIEVNQKPLIAFRYAGKDGVSRYYDEKGEPLGNAFLRYPLKFSRISSYFSTARFHPVLKRNQPHNGVDFAAPKGTPVRSVGDGTVIYADYKGPNGLLVKIDHGGRYSTAYAHLSKISRGIRRGSKVRRGQEIGAVGATGRATGPHLHYAFYDNNRFVDPLKIKLPNVVTDLTKIDRLYLEEMKRRLTSEEDELIRTANNS